MRAIRYHDEARLELVREVGYYSAVSPRLAERFDIAVQTAAQRAAESPSLGSPYFYGTRRVYPGKFKFSLVYLTFEHELLILAVAPFSRRPGYWQSRRSDG